MDANDITTQTETAPSRRAGDTKLSKRMSFLLRHRPDKGPITLDERGFTTIEELARALSSDRRTVLDKDVLRVAATDAKGRFEVAGERIRAVYGHSVEREIAYTEATPPDTLYHGTSRRALQAIMGEGLRPMGRRMVHLSADVETAVLVGSRHDSHPPILVVDAEAAHAAGVRFFRASATTWLTAYVDPAYLRLRDKA